MERLVMSKSDEWEEYRRSRYSKRSDNEDKDLTKKLALIEKAFKKSKWKI